MLLPLLQNNLLEGGSDVEVGVGVASLTLATHAATISYDINVAVDAASLTLATNAASVALDVAVNVGTAGLTLATHDAAVSYDVNVSASTAALTLTTYAATVDTGDVEVSVGTASLSLTTYPATIEATDAVEDEPAGGDDAWKYQGRLPKQRDYRPDLDEKRLRERQELRELIERAAGLIEEAAEEPAIAAQAAEAQEALSDLRVYTAPRNDEPQIDLAVIQERVDRLIAKSVDDLIVQAADLLTDLIHEIAEEE